MYKRSILKSLILWKNNTNRKPLILRGARQVGKTTLVREFGKSYRHFVYLNLERINDRKIFEQFDDVKEVVEAIFLQKKLPLDYANTLIFIDEIQEFPQSIQMLRYFYEDFPELHVIAAGSLLEFAMGNVKSFPVGRVQFLHLFPLNFEEFLEATEHQQALTYLNQIPISKVGHHLLKELYHQYAIMGGMPEVVKTYIEQKTIAALPPIYEGIWSAYRSDVEKYAKNDTEKKVIKHIMATAHNYLDERITFQNFGNSNYRSREVGEAFRALDDARIVQLIYPSIEVAFPIKTDFKKKPRMLFLDMGLINHSLNIQHEMIGMENLNDAFKGALVPHLIMQELISLNTDTYQKPVFWVREKSQSSAEVDLIFPYKEHLIPIEVKSGPTGKLRSLHQFMEICPHSFAVRMYSGEFHLSVAKTPSGKSYTILNLPYYLGTQLPNYIATYFGSHQ